MPEMRAHSAAQSSALAMTVTPLAVTIAPNPVSILYGQAIPPLSGTLTGVLAQDAGKVSAVFTSTAAALSPAGLYPISAMLTGSAAGNYTVAVTASTTANLSIAQAPTLTSLSASTSAPGLGLPVTLSVQSSSTTSGVPAGSITLSDGSATLCVVPLSAGGAATFTTSSLALGAHNLSATYSGDANFLPSSSATANVAVGPASDFTLTATGATSQSIPKGSSATYSFSVAMLGAAMSSPIALAVQGVPLGATSSINPSYIPPGGAVTSFTVTIQTPLAALGPVLAPLRRHRRQALGCRRPWRSCCCQRSASLDDAGKSSDSWRRRSASCWQRSPPDAAIASTRTTVRQLDHLHPHRHRNRNRADRHRVAALRRRHPASSAVKSASDRESSHNACPIPAQAIAAGRTARRRRRRPGPSSRPARGSPPGPGRSPPHRSSPPPTAAARPSPSPAAG